MRRASPRLASVLVAASLLWTSACSSGQAAGDTVTSPAPAGRTASALGTHEVSTRTLDLSDPSRTTDPTPDTPGDETQGRDLPTDIWYPAGDGPFPVIVFSPGVQTLPVGYEDLLSGWASAGFVVVAPTFPLTNRDAERIVFTDILNQPADVSFVLDEVLDLNATPGDALEGKLDAAHIGAAGHSGGAITTLLLMTTCCADARFSAAVVLSGTLEITGLSSEFTTPGTPTLVEHGTADDTIALADSRSTYAALPGPKAFVTLSGATHSTPYQNDPADENFPTVLSTTTGFLRGALAGDSAALTEFRDILAGKESTRLTDDQLGGGG
jgi:dienelactone hydrolase